jgi:hypothetical protein
MPSLAEPRASARRVELQPTVLPDGLTPAVRHAREDLNRDLTSRMIQLRAETVNEADRSVEAVLATDNPVEVRDWSEPDGTVEEILLMEGQTPPEQLPLLNNHNRWELGDQLGTVRQIRVEGNQLAARLFVLSSPVADSDEERVWRMIQQGMLTDVSIGYRVAKATKIPAGTSAVINGRTFTAGQRALRVGTAWDLRECSLVPIGADKKAKLREDTTTPPHPSGGLPVDEETRTDQAQQSAAAVAPPPPTGERAGVSPPVTPAAPTEAAIRDQATAAERERVREITALAGDDVPAAVRTQAINDGWSVDRASREFLRAVREARSQTGQTGQTGQTSQTSGPTIHSRNPSAELSVRSLAAGMIAAAGLDPTQARLYDGRRGRAGDQLTAQDADYGRRFERLSSVDLCRMCVQIDSGRIEWDAEEAIRMAISGGSLTYALGTSVYARLLAGWAEIPDSTDWCADEPDIPNFLQQEDVTLNVSTQFEALPRGGTASDASVNDQRETYKLARYAKKFTVDEQDFLSDRLGATLAVVAEMGNAARRLRPDLVYSVLLENPTLVADSGSLFNATAITTSGGHANLGTGALSTTNLATGIAAMAVQRKGNVVLNVRPRYLIVPAALQFTAATILTGIALAKTHATKADPDYVPINPVSNQLLQMLQQQAIELRVDDRIGASGVYDPRTKAVRTGLATNWFLSAGGPRTLRVGTRRGTGGLPQMRQYTLDKGQWGVGWDVNLDVCVVVADFPGLYKSTGAA